MTVTGSSPTRLCTYAGSHLLQFLLLTQKLGDPSGWPLCEAMVFRKEVLKGLNRYHMGWSQYFYADTKIFFYVGGNSGNENRNSCCILWVEMPLVLVTFSSLNILYNGKICCLLQWLVSINNVRGIFNFVIAFVGSGEVGDKVPHPSHSLAGGWRGVPAPNCLSPALHRVNWSGGTGTLNNNDLQYKMLSFISYHETSPVKGTEDSNAVRFVWIFIYIYSLVCPNRDKLIFICGELGYFWDSAKLKLTMGTGTHNCVPN